MSTVPQRLDEPEMDHKQESQRSNLSNQVRLTTWLHRHSDSLIGHEFTESFAVDQIDGRSRLDGSSAR